MTKIEQVAKALYEKAQSYSNLAPNKWEEHGPGVQNHYYNLARAAIEAMKEPTLYMINEGTINLIDPLLFDAKPIYSRMIDAALRE